MNDYVSFITTVLNEERTIEPFLRSLLLQTRPPDEIIIVDGMSTDRTLERVQRIVDEGNSIKIIQKACSVAEGRNIAIANASYAVIAVSDAGCILEPNWLEELTRPIFEGKADVSAGYHSPVANNNF